MLRTINIICVNDFHSEIMEGELTPGCAKISSAIRDFSASHPDTLVVFGCDNYRGDPISERSGGTAVTTLMRDLGVKASAVGNHEFDFEMDTLARWQAEGEYSFLAANLREKQSGKIPAIVRPYLIQQCGGIKIAFLGLATQESLDTAACSANVDELELCDGVTSARYWVDYLMSGQDKDGKPDAIIALTHFGLKYGADGAVEGEEMCALCQAVPELGGAFAAHWHQFMAERIADIPVSQGGCRGQGYARLKLTFNEENSLLYAEPSFIDLRPCKSDLEEEFALKILVQDIYHSAMKELGEVIGYVESDICHRDPVTNEVPVQGSALTALAVDVMTACTHADVALFYSGWIISGLPGGAITLYSLYRAFRSDNFMISMNLCGREIIRNLEIGLRTLKGDGASPLAVGGLKLVADMSRPFGERLVSAKFQDGRIIEQEKNYRIVVDDSLAGNSMGFDFSRGTDLVSHESTVRDCMVDFIRRAGHIPTQISGTVTLLY